MFINLTRKIAMTAHISQTRYVQEIIKKEIIYLYKNIKKKQYLQKSTHVTMRIFHCCHQILNTCPKNPNIFLLFIELNRTILNENSNVSNLHINHED